MDRRSLKLPGWREEGSPDFEAGILADELTRHHALLRDKLPDVDPGDLLTILHGLLRPFGTGRRFFLRKRPGGGYVI